MKTFAKSRGDVMANQKFAAGWRAVVAGLVVGGCAAVGNVEAAQITLTGGVGVINTDLGTMITATRAGGGSVTNGDTIVFGSNHLLTIFGAPPDLARNILGNITTNTTNTGTLTFALGADANALTTGDIGTGGTNGKALAAVNVTNGKITTGDIFTKSLNITAAAIGPPTSGGTLTANNITVSGGGNSNIGGTLNTTNLTVTGTNSLLTLAIGSTNTINGMITASAGGTFEVVKGATFLAAPLGLTLNNGTFKITGAGFDNAPLPVTLGAGGGTIDVAATGGDFIITSRTSIDSTSANGDALTIKNSMGTDIGKLILDAGTSNTVGALNVNGSTGKVILENQGNLTATNVTLTSTNDTTRTAELVLANGSTNNLTNITVAGSGAKFTVEGDANWNLTSTAANAITLSGGGTFSAAAGVPPSVNTNVASEHKITLGAGGGKLVAAAGMTLTQSGVITGANALTIGSTGNLGTVILSGANTYTGTTTIFTGATLQVDGAGTLGTGAITNNGTLTLNQIGDQTLTNNITGAGALVKNGANKLTLTSNGYAGKIDINVGTLVISSALNTNFTGGAITNARNLVFTQTAAGVTQTVTKVINGAGTLTKEGAGRLILNGNNTYAGNTLLDNGTLQLGHNNALGNGVGTLLIGGTDKTLVGAGGIVTNNNINLRNNKLNVESAGVYTLGGVIADTGGGVINKTGAGELILTSATSTYAGGTTLTAGKITVSADSTKNAAGVITQGPLGTGTLTVAAAGTTLAKFNDGVLRTIHNNINLGANILTVDNANAAGHFILAGNITGNGGITKTGAGNVILTGNNTYTGVTTVNTGILFISSNFTAKDNVIVAAAAGRLDVDPTFTLTIDPGKQLITAAGSVVNIHGTLMVTGVDATNIGAVRPIDNVLGGAIAFVAPAGKLAVQMNPADAPMVVGGVKELAFSTLALVAANDAKVTYSGNRLFAKTVSTVNTITIRRQDAQAAFPLISRSVADSLNSYTAGNAFLERVLDPANDDLTPRVDERLELGYNMMGAVGTAAQSSNLTRQMSNIIHSRATGAVRHDMNGQNMRGQEGQMPFAEGQLLTHTLWATPLIGHQDARGLKSGHIPYGFSSDLYGGAFGYETQLGRSKYGVAAMIGGGVNVSPGVATHTTAESFFGGITAYTSIPSGSFDLVTQIGWVGTENEVRQRTLANSILNSKVNGGAFFLSMLTERTTRRGNMLITPSVGLEYTCVYQQDYKTHLTLADGTHTPNVFAAKAAAANMLTIPVGIKATSSWRDFKGTGYFTPEIGARFLPNVADQYINYANTPFSIPGAAPAHIRSYVSDQLAADTTMGLTWRGGCMETGFTYNALISEHFTNHNVGFLFKRTW